MKKRFESPLGRTMSSSDIPVPFEQAPQVVHHDIGIEADARGIQYQSYDRDAPLEGTEAHRLGLLERQLARFQAHYQPDNEIEPTLHNQADGDQHQGRLPSRRSKKGPLWSKSLRKRSLWLGSALVVTLSLAITAAVLAAVYARKRFGRSHESR